MQQLDLHLYAANVANIHIGEGWVNITLTTDDLDGLLEEMTHAIVNAAIRKTGRGHSNMALKICNALLADDPKYKIVRTGDKQ